MMVYKNKEIRVLANNNNKIRYIQFSPENITEIDKRRAEIGLESYEEYVKKIEFFMKHKEYCFSMFYYKAYVG